MPGVVPLRHIPPPAHQVIKDKFAISKGDVRKPAPVLTHDLPPRRIRSSLDPRDQWINAIHNTSLARSDSHRSLQRRDFAHCDPSSRASAGMPQMASRTFGNPIFASIAPVRPKVVDIEINLEEVARYEKLVQDDLMDESGGFPLSMEELSPDPDFAHDNGSSPVGPATPFGDYVDRAMNTATIPDVGVTHDFPERQAPDAFTVTALDPVYRVMNAPVLPTVAAVHTRALSPQLKPQLELTATSSATDLCRRLAEPLSQWVSDYVWKICTSDRGLSQLVTSELPSRPQAPTPQALPESVRSLLLSTLLQPSAVFLALWYIARLPVYLGQTHAEGNAATFRKELLPTDASSESEVFAAFRVIVLGFMLANKWLDDHTFSNKTWHTISHIPIQSLNHLEFIAVGIFRHDLSIDPESWSQWLNHLRIYHSSLASRDGSPVTHWFPQPISRPSATPHSAIRKTLDDIIEASPMDKGAVDQSIPPQPVYLGLKDRAQAKIAKDAKMDEFDLDEDGPLREEYLPRRRTSGGHGNETAINMPQEQPSWEEAAHFHGRDALPPPAKWSPEADEPIWRERDHSNGRYVAVQPTLGFRSSMYRSAREGAHDQGAKQSLYTSTSYAVHSYEPRVHEYHRSVVSHTRSHSQQYGSDIATQNRARSNTRTDYQHPAVHSEMIIPPPPMLSFNCWAPLTTYALPYAIQSGHIPSVPMTWLRARA